MSGFFVGADGVGEAPAVGLAVGDDVEPGEGFPGLRLGSPPSHRSTVIV
jgi:hypothetical protein